MFLDVTGTSECFIALGTFCYVSICLLMRNTLCLYPFDNARFLQNTERLLSGSL